MTGAHQRRITGFHQDEQGDWVADLECGHTQHVRHDPPWQSRPWVTTEEGRRTKLGAMLVCVRCADEESNIDRGSMSDDIRIDVSRVSDEHDRVRAFVLHNLRAFNRQRAEPPDYQSLSLAIRHNGEMVGGLVGEIGWKWLFVDLFWIAESHRGRGIGTRLLREAEAEAVRRGALNAYLDTFDFQARPFYERHGYEVFGTLEDYPPGHCRFFMKKRLAPPGGPEPVR